jgi:mannose-6-phosphate isomerase-like protein (cupin superfamily)
VPDYVHFHRVRFQMIYCYRGWVRVVYEDQGPPFVMRAGDCVLQPPEIRHRVLECSAGLEVIEISSPAEHETWADPELQLPTAELRPEREFKGQRFLRHEAAAARWIPGRCAGLEVRDLGLAAASNQLAAGRIVRAAGAPRPQVLSHDAELSFLFVLGGAIDLRCEGHGALHLTPADSVVLPARMRYALESCSDDAEFLELHIPAALEVASHAMDARALAGSSSAGRPE